MNALANISVRNQTINGATESTKKELPKTGNTINYLLIWCGIALIIGSITLIKKQLSLVNDVAKKRGL